MNTTITPSLPCSSIVLTDTAAAAGAISLVSCMDLMVSNSKLSRTDETPGQELAKNPRNPTYQAQKRAKSEAVASAPKNQIINANKA